MLTASSGLFCSLLCLKHPLMTDPFSCIIEAFYSQPAGDFKCNHFPISISEPPDISFHWLLFTFESLLNLLRLQFNYSYLNFEKFTFSYEQVH